MKNDIKGLIIIRVGYMGGTSTNPTYKQVCTGTTNHAEVLLVEYDENKINYADLYVIINHYSFY